MWTTETGFSIPETNFEPKWRISDGARASEYLCRSTLQFLQTIMIKIVLPRDILRLSVRRIGHVLLRNYQMRDCYSNQRDAVHAIIRKRFGRGRLSTVGASLQSWLIVTVIAICETKSYEGSQFFIFPCARQSFCGCPGPPVEALSSQYNRVGCWRGWLILCVAEILGLDVQVSNMTRAFVLDFETSWNPLMRLGREIFSAPEVVLQET